MDVPQQELQEHFIEVHKLTETVISEEDEVHRSVMQSTQDLEDYFEKYRLNQNFFTKDEMRQQSNFMMVRGKNYIYIGGFTDRMKHGMGLLVAGRNIYEGYFQLNLKMGRGYHRFSSGALYVGDFVNGKPHGNGTFTYPNKEVYVGEFLNGLIHGSGMWKSPKGDRYIGEWRNNKADGYGIHVWINGDKYEGQFKEFLKHGQGFQKFANGDSYKGSYEGGKPNGYGEYTWHNGSVFKGQFKSGLRHGKGLWTKGGEEGDSYEGFYQNDRKCGDGIFKWSSGNVYKGQFFDDLRHGEGEMYWSDGSYYKGTWQKGLQHGRGIIRFKGMPERHGLFENNVLVMEDPIEQRLSIQNPMIAGDVKKSVPTSSHQIRFNSFYGEPLPYRKQSKHHQTSLMARTRRHNQSIQEIKSNEIIVLQRITKNNPRTLVKHKKK